MRSSLILVSLVSLCGIAAAQGDPAGGAPAEPAPPEPVPVMAPAPTPAPAPVASTSGLRNGFSLSVGQEFGTTDAGQDFSGQLYGFDWRIGWRVNAPISVYLHSHLSFGTVGPNKAQGAGGITGNFAGAIVDEYMLPMRIFAGAGAGYGVLNNPNGPLVEARAGYYPFKTDATGKARRLNVAVDARWYMVGSPYGTVTQISLSLGYDRF
jgi:hypothetical protein